MSRIRLLVLPVLVLSGVAVMIVAAALARGSISVTPSAAHDGRGVIVTVAGCDARSATVTSTAFHKPITLTVEHGKLTGTGAIAKTASGRYGVQAVCAVGKSRTTIKGSLVVTTPGEPAQADPVTSGKPAR